MTITSTDSPSASADGRRGRPWRWVFRACVAVAVLPIAVAAVRNGLSGWEPTWDAATTAVRVRDVFSAHPPLYGLVGSPSADAEPYSYLGAIEFYLLAVPVKFLGTTWGLLLGMSAINMTALSVALWLIRRRVGDVGGMVASAFAASLLWTLGSEFTIDPTPVQAVTLPFFTLLVAAWSVADDDGPALIACAAVANYLILTHPAMLIVAPMVAATALVYWIRRIRTRRRAEPSMWALYARSRRRFVAGSIAVTIIAWSPPVYEQLTAPHGNIELLVRAAFSGGGSHASTTWRGALGVVTSITAVPPFWLPPNFMRPPFDSSGDGQSVWLRILATGILIALGTAVVRSARRSGDTSTPKALVISAVAAIGWVISWRANPSDVFPTHYFWGVWSLSTFVWLLLAVAVGRALLHCSHTRPYLGRHVRLLGCVAMVGVMSILAIPRRNHCVGHCASSLDSVVMPARQARSKVARSMRGQRAVQVPSSLGTDAFMQPALVLGLQGLRISAGCDRGE